MLAGDVIVELLGFVDGRDWDSLSRCSKESYHLTHSAISYILNSWVSSQKLVIPQHLHELLHERRLFELYIYLSRDCSSHIGAVDGAHRTLLDLSVELRMYCFSELLVSLGFKSSIEAETMFHCIRNRDLRGSAILISCGIPIDRFRSRDDGLNVLTCAVMFGSAALVDLFLTNGVSIPDGILVQAVLSRHSDDQLPQIVALLLDKAGCDPNSRFITGLTALHVAIAQSPFASQLIDILVSRGADVNARSGSEGGGNTALDVAAKKRKRNCYDALVSRGAVHSLLYGVETGDVSIIHSYISSNSAPSEDVVKYLISFGAALGRTESVKELLESKVVSVNEILVRNDITPLHLAACRGHSSVCKLLLANGADVSARTHGGMDIHIYGSNITGSPLWFNPAEYGPNGSILPPPVRLKTAAELAREAGYEKLARLLDFAMVESVIVRKESFDSFSSSSGAHTPASAGSSVPLRHFQISNDESSEIVLRFNSQN